MDMTELISSINTTWVLIAAALVFFMQAGFAMVEAGFTRAKNSGNIIMKNLMDFCIGTPLFWLVGFGIMFGSSSGFFGGIDLFTRGDYSSILPEGVTFFAYSFSRRFSAPLRQLLFPEQWPKGQNSVLTVFIPPS